MIRYNNSSQLLQKPVTTGGASARWTLELGQRSTDIGWPGWSSPTVLWSRFGLQFLDLLYGFSPDIYITSVNIRYRYCLNILSTWVEQSHRGLSWFMNNTIIFYESHLITTQIRSGFYIYVTSCKFLGITLDESLSWRKQLSSINSKISKALFIIKQVKFSLPIESLHTLYFSLLHPHLTYGILAWRNAKNNLLQKTQTSQKRAMRTIYNKRYNSNTDPLFKESRILKISDLYQLEVMTFMHDIIHGKLPISFDNIYHMNYQIQGVYETRQAHMFHVPRTKSRFVDNAMQARR